MDQENAQPGTTPETQQAAAEAAAETPATDAPRLEELPPEAAAEPIQPSPAGEATTTQPALPQEAPVAPGAPDWGVFVGLAVALLIAVFFGYALARARRRRRAELQEGEPVAEGGAGPAFPPAPPVVPPEGPQALPGSLQETPEAARPTVAVPPEVTEAPPEAFVGLERAEAAERRRKAEEKARRRQEFLDQQRLARSAQDARKAAQQAATAAARREAEAEAQRETAELERRREALLAPSGSLTQSLSRTRGGFISRLNAVLGRQPDESTLEQLEEVLFTADIGVHTATRLIEAVRSDLRSKELSDPEKLKAAVRRQIVSILEVKGSTNGSLAYDIERGPRPYVLMVVGVNGVGKTTTIGKLAGHFAASGKRVVLAAGDTFRAAAVEQLEVWADRVGADLVRGPPEADPGAVAFDAVRHALATDADVVIVDTAGRLHTKVPLMAELEKVQRVLGKARDGAPDDVLLVVDATTGQNAIQQAKLFLAAVPISGIALTKLDGTAKGGVIIGIADELSIPVRYIGVGEKVGDLRPFEPDDFVQALFA